MARRNTMNDKIPKFTGENLDQGMIEFLIRWEKEKDFSAQLYRDLRGMSANMFTSKWWGEIYRTNSSGSLTKWIATRNAQNNVRKDGVKQLGGLSREYKRILASVKNPSIESCDWETIAGLFGVALKIKKTKGGSPVFASKLCHFILPAVFPVFDGAALNLVNDPNADDYEAYWKVCRQRWCDCDCKAELKKILRDEIERAGGKPVKYPWAPRIAELCVMGRKK